MMKNKSLLNCGIIFLSLVFALFFFETFCEAMNLRIDQPKIRLSVMPGAVESGKIIISNASQETVDVKVYLEDWVYNPACDGSKTFYPPGTIDSSCAGWITFAPAEFSILPYGKQSISYTVNCPAGVRGGHFAVLFFETLLGEGRDEQGVGVMLKGRLGSLFYVEPKGSIRKDAEIKNLKVEQDKDADISFDFINTGNIDLYPEGTFYIMDKKGVIAARGVFARAYTFPGNSVKITASIPEDRVSKISPGRYDIVITIDIGGLPKVYEAELNMDPSGKLLLFHVN